jgi:diguanylate cyclase (GGDEF)-like protein
MIVGSAILLSFVITGSLYALTFGIDDRFWDALTFSIVVTLIVAAPISWTRSVQRERLYRLTEKLKETQRKLRSANSELQHKASYDGMTKLANREKFFEYLDDVRQNNERSILMIIDVDHFKKINDHYGHPIGDKALISLSNVLRRILRTDDIVGRIGGEEFGILLPDTSEAEGQIIGEMIRHEVEEMVFEPHPGLRHVVTVSVGVTCAMPYHQPANLLRHADTALLEAKRSGRNQVVMFEPGLRTKPRPFYDSAQDQKSVKIPSIMR